MKERDFSIDFIKAFAIFLVVLDHLIRKTDGAENPMLTFIYSVHMPLFFMASGLLSAKKLCGVKELALFLLKKTKLLIPFFVFGLGNVIVLNQSIGEFLIWHKFGLWFLWTLFLFFCIYTISQGLLLRSNNKIIEMVVLVIPVFLCIYLRKCQNTELGGILNFLNFYNYTFFILGVLYQRYFKNFLESELLVAVIFVLYVVCLIIGTSVLNIPMKICGCLFFLALARKFTSNLNWKTMNDWEKVISIVGQNSLFIYVLHYYFIANLTRLPETIHSIVYGSPCVMIPFCFIVALGIIFMCIVIANVLCKNKYIGFCLFGK